MSSSRSKKNKLKPQVKTTKLADIDGYMLSKEMEALKPILPPEIQKPIKMLEFLACNNRSTSFPNLFIANLDFLDNPSDCEIRRKEFFQAETEQNLLEIINSARTFEQFSN